MKTGCIKPRRLIKPAMAGGRSFVTLAKNRAKRTGIALMINAGTGRPRSVGTRRHKKTAPKVGAVMVGGKIQSA